MKKGIEKDNIIRVEYEPMKEKERERERDRERGQ